MALFFFFLSSLFKEADCHGNYFWKAREDMGELQKTSSKDMASSEASAEWEGRGLSHAAL